MPQVVSNDGCIYHCSLGGGARPLSDSVLSNSFSGSTTICGAQSVMTWLAQGCASSFPHFFPLQAACSLTSSCRPAESSQGSHSSIAATERMHLVQAAACNGHSLANCCSLQSYGCPCGSETFDSMQAEILDSNISCRCK